LLQVTPIMYDSIEKMHFNVCSVSLILVLWSS
jgi:hypothetical protein